MWAEMPMFPHGDQSGRRHENFFTGLGPVDGVRQADQGERRKIADVRRGTGVHQIISLAWPGRSAEEPATEDAAVAELDAWRPANEG
jgi:hypothetical protein